MLTTMSRRSNLTEVADLNSGNIVSGFGDATVQYLEATSDTVLRGNVTMGSTHGDDLIINSRLKVSELVINHPNNHGFSYELTFPTDISGPLSVAFPPEEYVGELLTVRSEFSSLTAVSGPGIESGGGGMSRMRRERKITMSRRVRFSELSGRRADGWGYQHWLRADPDRQSDRRVDADLGRPPDRCAFAPPLTCRCTSASAHEHTSTRAPPSESSS